MTSLDSPASLVCPRCAQPMAESQLESFQYSNCSQCGFTINPLPKNGPLDMIAGIIKAYFHDLVSILARPSQFFKTMPKNDGVARPLAFALVTHWLGAGLAFLWQSALGVTIGAALNRMLQMTTDSIDLGMVGQSDFFMKGSDRLMQWLMGAGPVIIDPFTTLFSIGVTSIFVFIGARILASKTPQPVTFESAMRIVCFGMTPTLFEGVPLIGGLLAGVGIITVTAIGAREVYQVGTARAVIIALFPRLLWIGAIGFGIFAVLLLVLQTFASLAT